MVTNWIWRSSSNLKEPPVALVLFSISELNLLVPKTYQCIFCLWSIYLYLGPQQPTKVSRYLYFCFNNLIWTHKNSISLYYKFFFCSFDIKTAFDNTIAFDNKQKKVTIFKGSSLIFLIFFSDYQYIDLDLL